MDITKSVGESQSLPTFNELANELESQGILSSSVTQEKEPERKVLPIGEEKINKVIIDKDCFGSYEVILISDSTVWRIIPFSSYTSIFYSSVGTAFDKDGNCLVEDIRELVNYENIY